MKNLFENKNDGVRNARTQKKPLRRKLIGWLAYAVVFALIFYFFAPESWRQFGVAPAAKRKAAANFILKDLQGAEWNFSKRRGRVVVVNYWATWCLPCRVETPGLVSFADEYKARGVETVGVTLDEDLSVVESFVENYGIKYPILVAGFDPNVGTGGMALPTTFLYDKNGRLAKKYTGLVLESTLRSDANALLAEE